MKYVWIAILVVIAASYWCAAAAQGQPPEVPDHLATSEDNPDYIGRQLRLRILTLEPDSGPTKKFPRVWGVCMDWPVGKEIATLCTSDTGDASLYTTSSLGIIGGHAHPKVRSAAKRFVRAADQYYDLAAPTSEYPYPRFEQARFYLKTFEGVRLIEADLASVTEGEGDLAEFFSLGQTVVTELRDIYERFQ